MSPGSAQPKTTWFRRILQTDGYAVYDKVGGPKLVHAACWRHSRRKFYEARQVCPDESVAKGSVLRIDDLFGIDAAARTQNLESAARDQLRQQQARPLLEMIRQQIEAAREQALPASKLGGAIAYTLGLWKRLKRFLDYPELELSNNLAENSMRSVALGRKNWIHIELTPVAWAARSLYLPTLGKEGLMLTVHRPVHL